MNDAYIRWVKHPAEWVFYFIRYLLRQFQAQRGMQIASALAYATLLSLVPLVTVALAFLQGLPIFEQLGSTVQQFMISNFVPTFGDTIQDYLATFSSQASQLTITGLLVLFAIALMLMGNIDRAFNTIWHVRRRRNPVSRFLVYWAILTLGPLLLGVGLIATSYLLSVPALNETGVPQSARQWLLSWIPFITTTIAFTLMYILIPNCFVLRRYALVGGITAALLFEVAKYGFGIYVRTVPTHETIYGALAVIPLFLIWIYTSWVVLLLGAHISFCFATFDLDQERSGRGEMDWRFEDAYHLVALLWDSQKQGRALSVADLVKRGVRMPQYQVNEIMDYLEEGGWVQKNSNGAWLLSRDLDDVSLLDLHHIIPRQLPFQSREGRDPRLQTLYRQLEKYRQAIDEGLAVPLSELLQAKES